MKNTTAIDTKAVSPAFHVIMLSFAAAGMLISTPVLANPPSCPFESRFGANDEIGASQTQTTAKVLKAIRLIDTGRVFPLAHIMDETTIPKPFNRVFDVEMETLGPFEQMVFHQGTLLAHFGQLGTQIDALAHPGDQTYGFYNCIPLSDVEPDENGLVQKLGIETVRPFFTRAVLFDLVHYMEGVDQNGLEKRKGEILPASFVVNLQHVRQVLKAEGFHGKYPLEEGDVAIFYTGWDRKFGTTEGNPELLSSPGIGVEVADWLARQKVAMVAADNLSVEAMRDGAAVDVLPPNHPLGAIVGSGAPQAVHLRLITAEGIHLLELLKLEALAEAMLDKKRSHHKKRKGHHDNPYEFAFIYAPVPVKGMAGSSGQPLAID